MALVAVGGYGRRELLPGSDLDVLLLHDGRPGIAAMADRIWYPIWDSGTRLDHAVRTPAEARRVAQTDLKVVLGLLYARHVAGDPDLTERAAPRGPWRTGGPAAGTRLAELQALHVERTAAQRRAGFPARARPQGGPRRAAGRARHPGHRGRVGGALARDPGSGPRTSRIMDARHALHEITGRRTDRLVLQEQDEVARVLGLLDADALMRHLAGAGRARRLLGGSGVPAGPAQPRWQAAEQGPAPPAGRWPRRAGRRSGAGPARDPAPTRPSRCGPRPRPPRPRWRSRRAR